MILSLFHEQENYFFLWNKCTFESLSCLAAPRRQKQRREFTLQI